MATAFVLRTTKTKGPAVLTARITLKSLGVNLLVSTGIPVLIEEDSGERRRGVQKANAITTTSAFSGIFLKDERTRNEFLNLISDK